MDDRVPATVNLLAARASLKVAELEALEKQTPSTAATSNTRLSLARRLRSARALAASWHTVAALIETEQIAADALGVDKQSSPAPERVIGWVRYPENSPDQLVCNRPVCKNAYSGATSPKWFALRAGAEITRSCDQCGRGLSA